MMLKEAAMMSLKVRITSYKEMSEIAIVIYFTLAKTEIIYP